MTTAGVIGLGDIGKGVAEALVRAGLDLVVCDLRPESTAPFASSAAVTQSPAEVGAQADVVVVAVVNDAQVRAVVDGPEGALQSMDGGAVIVLSTVAPSTVEALAEVASARGVDVLDCAVSGGPEASAAGALVAMVGGEEAAIDRVRPVLDAFTSLVVPMGPVGAGLKAKLARNLVQYGSWLAAYEAQVLAEAAGIELAKLALVIRESDKFIGGASRLMFRDDRRPLPPAPTPATWPPWRRGPRWPTRTCAPPWRWAVSSAWTCRWRPWPTPAATSLRPSPCTPMLARRRRTHRDASPSARSAC